MGKEKKWCYIKPKRDINLFLGKHKKKYYMWQYNKLNNAYNPRDNNCQTHITCIIIIT